MEERNTNERIVMTVLEIKREIVTAEFLLNHAKKRQEELRALDIPKAEENRERRKVRGIFLTRLQNEITDYQYRVDVLKSMLAGMEE